MSYSRVSYTPLVSDEVRAAIDPYLLRWSFLIPAWCHEVNVTWRDDDLDGALMREALGREHPELRAWADEMIRHSNESVTCDLTALVLGRLA